jgi:Fur family transcriptional regulator, ferric uptake regulator
MILIMMIKMKKISNDAADAVSALESFLKDRGLKMTVPRRTVLEVFLSIEEHVTAEDLLASVRNVDPRIGQATVFRTVRLFEEAGLARAACRDEGPRRFEHAYRHAHHDHLVCADCGEIVEFADEAIERAQEAVYGRYGFEAVGHSLELRGRCPACRKKAGKREKAAAAGGEEGRLRA